MYLRAREVTMAGCRVVTLGKQLDEASAAKRLGSVPKRLGSFLDHLGSSKAKRLLVFF